MHYYRLHMIQHGVYDVMICRYPSPPPTPQTSPANICERSEKTYRLHTDRTVSIFFEIHQLHLCSWDCFANESRTNNRLIVSRGRRAQKTPGDAGAHDIITYIIPYVASSETNIGFIHSFIHVWLGRCASVSRKRPSKFNNMISLRL